MRGTLYFSGCRVAKLIRDGEIGDGEIGEGGCEETFHCSSLTYKHDATCSCFIELNKQWYTFLPNWDISRVLFYILFVGRNSKAVLDRGRGRGT
jgi:hypothetical protein